MCFKIGNIEIKNPIVLAPMAGISNPSYMKICEEMGVGYAVTELISSEAIVRENKKTLEMLKGIDTLKIPVAVQLFGSNPASMARAAKIVIDLYRVPIIDINMGCPVPKVANRANAGSALLKDPEKVYELISTVVKNVSVPVTVKIRSGWDASHINAVEIAKMAEKAGASAICIHPRTRSQGYTGKADWDVIKEVKKAVSIPVIGSGDVTSPLLAKEMLLKTNCDAVMIGRAALGNPWIFKECVEYLEKGTLLEKISLKEKIQMIKKHALLLMEIKPEKVVFLEMRAHAAWYLKKVPNSSIVKEKINKVETKEELFTLLEEFLEEFHEI